jgi:hypothetical protein
MPCSDCYPRSRHSKETRAKIATAHLGKIVSESTRQKMSQAKKGKTAEEIWGLEHSKRMRQERSKKWSGKENPNYENKIPFTIKYRRNLRLAHLHNRFQKTPVYPNYNPEACSVIDQIGRELGYSFQHAENGGEVFLEELGYWLDGYDPQNNIAIEFYEPHHIRTKDRDKRRQKEIQELLGCTFIVATKSGYFVNPVGMDANVLHDILTQ